MITIEVSELKKYFGKTKAVDGVSFKVEKGEIFGFLGPNGAGKTTTIRCMMDFIRPTAGSINILGKDVQKDYVLLKKDIGYLSGEDRLYESWSGQDHIELLEKIRGKSKILADLVSRLNFNPQVRVKNLSTGNRQKLNLILALMHQPKVLILDEPTIGLDPLLQNTIYTILREFQDRGCTIFMSSHNLHEVELICHKVGIIKEGKIVSTETISNLRKKKLYRVTIYFDDIYNSRDFQIEGVTIIQKNSNMIILQIRQDINPIIKKLAKYRIKDLEVARGSLEEVFLEFYKKE